MKYLLTLFIALTAHAALALPVIPATVTTKNSTVPLKLELAITPETRARGLMERNSLAPNDGMLFVFPKEERLAFWMKNTPLSLDMLFIGADGTIVDIAPKTTPLSEVPIHSSAPAISVIELAGGEARTKGIAVGDKVTYTLPAGAHVQ